MEIIRSTYGKPNKFPLTLGQLCSLVIVCLPVAKQCKNCLLTEGKWERGVDISVNPTIPVVSPPPYIGHKIGQPPLGTETARNFN